MSLLAEIEQGQEDWAFCLGVQAYVWGYPLVECWQDRLKKFHGATGTLDGTGLNVFRHVRALSTPDSSEFVNAASDFLYSTAVLDLRAGPLLLTGPNFGTRWYGLQILDAYMETVANIGTRTVGACMPEVLITNQEAPSKAGQQIIRVRSPFLYIVVRIAAGPDENLTTVHTLQDQLQLRPGAGETDAQADKPPVPLVQDAAYRSLPREGDALEFFAQLSAVTRWVPPRPDEGMMLGLLQELGVHPGKQFETAAAAPAVRRGLERAVICAESILRRKLFEVGKDINGWGLVKDIGNYGHNYIIRALVARHGIWANVPDESMYFIARTDSRGELLHGRNCYRITFPAGATPPVQAFWSISYYDEAGRLIHNPQHRYSLNSRYGGLHYDADGSLTLLIGGTQAPALQKNNWLPSHDGVFFLNLRCYNPEPALLDLRYRVPPIRHER